MSDTTRTPRPSRLRAAWAPVATAVVAVVVFLVILSVRSGGSTQPTFALDGHHVATFTLSGLSGPKVSSPWQTGHPSVVIFFASWCTPCKAELPRVATYVTSHALGTVRVIGVDVNDETGAAKKFVANAGVTFPVGVDPQATLSGSEFLLPGLPDTAFVTATGVVSNVVVGAVSNAELTDDIGLLR